MASRRIFGVTLTAALTVAIGRWYSRRDEIKPVKIPVVMPLKVRLGNVELSLTYEVREFSSDRGQFTKEDWLSVGILWGRMTPVSIGGIKIPSSKEVYLLYVIPGEAQWTLAVVGPGLLNQVELGRRQMATRRLDSFVEKLELLFEDGYLKMRWGKTEASVDIAVA